MSIRWIRISIALALVAFAALSVVRKGDAHHFTLRANLEEITVAADRAFVGTCVGVEETEEMIAQGMMPVTRYTFEVERSLKGKLPKQFTFTQLGHPAHRSLGKGDDITIHGRTMTTATLIHGASQYNVGDRVILFLVKDYLGGKVTKPVADDQGAFYVSQMPSGQKLVRNNVNNIGLFTTPYNNLDVKDSDAKIIFPESDDPVRMSPVLDDRGISISGSSLVDVRGALPLDTFLGLVEQIVAAHGGEKGVVNQ